MSDRRNDIKIVLTEGKERVYLNGTEVLPDQLEYKSEEIGGENLPVITMRFVPKTLNIAVGEKPNEKEEFDNATIRRVLQYVAENAYLANLDS